MPVRPFITVTADHKYAVDAETATWLCERTTPFKVLGCVGKYRTGKSFMLNRLTRAPPGKGFGVGDTVQACTRGLWLATDLMDDGLLVVDTEGIDALDAESDHDVRILALAVLLSTSLVYNSMSHLDEAAVQTLSLMARVAEALGEAEAADDAVQRDETRASPHAPSLYWVLRDFALQLVDAEGNALSHTDYLEQALALPSPGKPKCATREAIHALFPERHLVTLPKPHRGDTAQKLDLKTASNLAPRFVRYVDTFRDHILKHGKTFAVEGVPASGAVYVAHARTLVDRLNASGGARLPPMRDAWTLLREAQHAEATARATTALHARVESACPVGDAAALRRWCETEARAVLGGERFVAPPPDTDALVRALADDGLARARALGRERDVAALVAERCAAFVRTMEAEVARVAGGVADMGAAEETSPTMAALRLDLDEWSRARDDACDGAATRTALAAVLDHALPAACARALECAADGALARREAETLRGALDVHVVVAREDACVATSDDPEGLGWEAEPGGNGGGVGGGVAVGGAAERGVGGGGGASPGGECDGEDVGPALESCLRGADARLSESKALVATLRARVTALEARETEARDAFDASMERLTNDTLARVQAAEARATEAEARAERAEASDAARAAEARAVGVECDKMRAWAREAHDKALDAHRAAAEELRRRDAELLAAQVAQRREHAAVAARAEGAAAEGRALKRRVDELLVDADEAKRLRMARVRDETERESLRAQLESERDETRALRERASALEARVAVLGAAAKLEACRGALIGA